MEEISSGVLANGTPIKAITYYCVIQCIIVIMCISSQYRLMVYHICMVHVDNSKIISLPTLWHLFLESTLDIKRQKLSKLNHSNTTFIPNSNNAVMNALLSDLKNSDTPPIHVYTGLFDANVVLSSDIETYVRGTITDAYPLTLKINSVDFAALLYSLAVVCYCALYHATLQKINTSTEMSDEDNITDKNIHEDFLLYDLFFWLIVIILIFIVLEISSQVSVVEISLCFSILYSILLYITCSISAQNLYVTRCISFFLWFCTALILLIITNASILNGSALIFLNIILVIFYYITVVENDMSIIKFLNLRFWATVFMNCCFMVVYLNSLILVDLSNV